MMCPESCGYAWAMSCAGRRDRPLTSSAGQPGRPPSERSASSTRNGQWGSSPRSAAKRCRQPTGLGGARRDMAACHARTATGGFAVVRPTGPKRPDEEQAGSGGQGVSGNCRPRRSIQSPNACVPSCLSLTVFPCGVDLSDMPSEPIPVRTFHGLTPQSSLEGSCALSGLAANSSIAAASMASCRFCPRSMSRSSRHRAQRKAHSSLLRYAHLRHPRSATNAALRRLQDFARRTLHSSQLFQNPPRACGKPASSTSAASTVADRRGGRRAERSPRGVCRSTGR